MTIHRFPPRFYARQPLNKRYCSPSLNWFEPADDGFDSLQDAIDARADMVLESPGEMADAFDGRFGVDVFRTLCPLFATLVRQPPSHDDEWQRGVRVLLAEMLPAARRHAEVLLTEYDGGDAA